MNKLMALVIWLGILSFVLHFFPTAVDIYAKVNVK